MLEYCHNERDPQGPQDYISLVDIPTRNPSSPQSPQELGEITWMEPITITEWTQLPDWPDNESEVPATYDCIKTHTRFTAGKSMWERRCDSGMLCRKPNQELVIVKMRTFTLVYGPELSDFVEWDFPRPSGPQDQSQILAARFVSDDVVEVTYPSACKRKTVDVRLRVLGYGKRRHGTHVLCFDPISGQLFVEMKGESIMLQY
ncbi:hypothetical protein SISNIDRAFT_461700 [Sistotremastrum niveocremeum HHB9708]|uniref:Uncharacterized protein n=1 Tax=Sistotremastrum niveocremeum HHB9708 TaxID=1314777 RepID=A0A164M2Y7_9AGAM|nr:hypothetical protein SISNIDRAFT_461700 [Sistotremastrum niveocremeum HHB9708]